MTLNKNDPQYMSPVTFIVGFGCIALMALLTLGLIVYGLMKLWGIILFVEASPVAEVAVVG